MTTRWTLADAYDALAVAQSFDRRTVGDYDAAGWARAIGDLNLTDAKQAIIDHYGTSTDWLMPGHVRAGVNRIRANRLNRDFDAIPNANPDDVPAYLEALRQDRTRVADGTEKPRDMHAITGVFPSPPTVDETPVGGSPRNAPTITGLPAVDPERMAAARAELDTIRGNTSEQTAEPTGGPT
jgi:hypothetical protein